MNKIHRSNVIGTLLIVLIAFSLIAPAVASGPVTPPPQAPQSIKGGPSAILRWDPIPSNFHVPPPREFSQLHIQSATITVNYLPGGTTNMAGTYCYEWPNNAKTAFGYAASIWASLINSSVPIEINACWAELNPGVLGYGGALTYHTGFTGSQPNTQYPAALANARSGTDLNDSDGYDNDGDGSDDDDDMILAYSRSYNWYFGTNGNPLPDQLDFVSVVLHEIAHGLGFSGSMNRDDGVYNPSQGNYQECNGTAGMGCWGWGTGNPVIYDRFTENGSGQSLINASLFPNPSAALGTQLTSGNVYFDGANANAANGSSRPKLYAPSTWQPGSSYAHLDEIYNGTANALMTYSLGNGESEHDPGPIALGILQDVGWTTPGAAAPTVTSITPASGVNTGTVHITNLAGTNFQSGATVKLTKASQSDINATNVAVASASQITCDFALTGATTGQWNVVVTNPDMQSGQRPNGFRVYAPGGSDYYVHLPLILRCYPLVPFLQPISNPDGDGIYTVTWSWPPCGSSPSYYELQGDDDPSFGSPSTFTEYDTDFEAYSPAPATYYWRVRGYVSGTGVSAWSNVQSVTVGSFAYVWIDNDTGGSLTVEIVGVEKRTFSTGYDGYWRSVSPGQYTYKAWARCGSGSWTKNFAAGYKYELRFWCTYSVASTPAALLGQYDVHASPMIRDFNTMR